MLTKSSNQNVLIHSMIIIALVASAFYLWGGCLDDFFAQDDFLLLEGTNSLTNSHRPLLPALLDVGPVDNGYRPLSTTLYFTIMQKLFGLHPRPYHLVNLLLHTLNGLMIYWAVLKISKNNVAAFLSALFFLGRSLVYVTVFWVSEIQDVLPCFFCLLFVILVIGYVKTFASRWYWLAVVAYILGVHSKEVAYPMAACVIPLWLAIRWPSGRNEWQKLLISATFLLLVGPACWAFRWHVMDGMESAYCIQFETSYLKRLLTFVCWTFYGKYIVSDILLYSINAACLVLFLLPLIRLKRNNHHPGNIQPYTGILFVCMAAISALPTLFLVDREPQYYAYIPSVFLAMGFGSLLAFWIRSYPTKTFFLYGLAATLLLFSTYLENKTTREKDNASWIRAIENPPEDRPWSAYQDNPHSQWSGGWLNTDARICTSNLYRDLRRLLPDKLPDNARILLIGWRYIPSGSNLRSNSGKLTDVSSIESMMRVFWHSRHLVLRIVQDHVEEDVDHVYYVRASMLDSFISNNPHQTHVFIVNPVEGKVMEYYRPGSSHMKNMSSKFWEFFNRWYLRG